MRNPSPQRRANRDAFVNICKDIGAAPRVIPTTTKERKEQAAVDLQRCEINAVIHGKGSSAHRALVRRKKRAAYLEALAEYDAGDITVELKAEINAGPLVDLVKELLDTEPVDLLETFGLDDLAEDTLELLKVTTGRFGAKSTRRKAK